MAHSQNKLVIISLLLVICPWLSVQQQFPDLTVNYAYEKPTSACLKALNSTITCTPTLRLVSEYNEFLDERRLKNLCTEDCRQSIDSFKATIKKACPSDKIIKIDNSRYPPNWFIDKYSYAYDLSCRKDATSGKFCDILLQDNSTPTNCSDCRLGTSQIMLNSPLGYNEEFAKEFDATTSSCGTKAYPYTKPAGNIEPSTQTTVAGNVRLVAPALSTLASGSLAPTNSASVTGTGAPRTQRSCSDPYTLAKGDTPVLISQRHNVSTFSLIYENNLSLNLKDFPAAGQQICLPKPCSVYLVDGTETCQRIGWAQKPEVSVAQLQAWNPNLNILCANVQRLKGTYICTSPPGGFAPASESTSASIFGTGVVPAPVNVENGTTLSCAKYYTVQKGDHCFKVSLAMGIPLKQFLALNTQIDSKCSNLKLGVAYCVHAASVAGVYSGTINNGAISHVVNNTCDGFDKPSSCYSSVEGLQKLAYEPWPGFKKPPKSYL